MKRQNELILIGLTIAVVMAVLVSPVASSFPDGLEKVAEHKGFVDKATVLVETIIPDYLFPGISNEKVATAVAGLVGTILTFFIVYIAARLLIKEKSSKADNL